MFAVQCVSLRVLAARCVGTSLLASGLVLCAPAFAQSSGPSTTGGALPYVTGPSKPAASATTAPTNPTPATPSTPATTAAETAPVAPAAPPAEAAPGVRVIDLSKREPNAPATPVTAPSADAPTSAPAAPAVVTSAPHAPMVDFTPAELPGAGEIASTPPSIDAPAAAVTAAPPAPARVVADAPKPKARPKAKVAGAKPAPIKRAPQRTARLEQFDQDVEVDLVEPRPSRVVRTPRLAGYDAWGRPIYYLPRSEPRERLIVRAPRFLDEDWVDAPPARLRRLPPVTPLRPFPPGSFRSENCHVVFYTDELGITRRTTRCR